ncbi:MAG: C40 family peptidase [Bosea sp.]|jgi:cell wall-associated NlpC family hydrolase|nr:C40 family peptidase [Bosea sp. (in: a-proteobacteria)]
MTALDRRLHAWRPDLADASLLGRVEAARFVAGEPMQVITHAAPLRREPRKDAGLDTEALCGEIVTVFEVEEGWAWGQLASDGYVGYLPAERLGAVSPPATHRVSAVRTFAYPGPSMKLPRAMTLSLGSRVHVLDRQGDFAVVAGVAGLARSFIWAQHLSALDAHAHDPMAVAEQLLHAPYLWGGKSSMGLDCSGLVQLSLDAAGISVPRDSDLQERSAGLRIGPDAVQDGALPPLRRGDLVFWKGHVGLMQDETRLLHANGHHMLVASEPLAVAVERILARGGGPITSLRRIG